MVFKSGSFMPQLLREVLDLTGYKMNDNMPKSILINGLPLNVVAAMFMTNGPIQVQFNSCAT